MGPKAANFIIVIKPFKKVLLRHAETQGNSSTDRENY